MKKFIHMLQTIYSHDFYRIMQELQESKQECAMFLPCSEEMFQNPNIISQYSTMISQLVVNYQLNLTECIFPDGVDVSNRPDYEIAFRHHKCDFSPNMSEMARQYRLGNSFPTCWEKVIYAR